MKVLFLLIAILFNFFNPSLLQSEEKIYSANNKIQNLPKKESINKNKTEKIKIHIVKIGDTISSISKLYSINKDLIIKSNNLKNENYIYVGQNLIISKSNENSAKKSDLIENYHVVQIGENLTEISNNYKLNLGYLIEINGIKNPDSIKVGQKLFLSKNNPTSSENNQIFKNKNNIELLDSSKQIYGPITIQDKSFAQIKGRKVLNVINQENKKLILAIDCDKNQLDVRIPGRKWMGSEPAKEKFEKNLIKDFC